MTDNAVVMVKLLLALAALSTAVAFGLAKSGLSTNQTIAPWVGLVAVSALVAAGYIAVFG